MGMLKNEPPIIYMYKCIKSKGDWSQGDVFTHPADDLDSNYFIPIGTYRKAFIGDMQERIDEAMKMDVMKHYAETVPGFVSQLIVHVPYYIKADYTLKGFIAHIKEKRKQRRKDKEDKVLDELFYGKKTTYPKDEIFKNPFIKRGDEEGIEKLRGQGFFNIEK